MGNKLIMTVGLPRSGKSTWAREQGHPVVSPDAIRLAMHGQSFVAETEPYVQCVAHTMVMALFLAGHDTVILDACNTHIERRKVWESPAWEREFVIFDTDFVTCSKRAIIGGRCDLLGAIERMWFEADYSYAEDTGQSYVEMMARKEKESNEDSIQGDG